MQAHEAILSLQADSPKIIKQHFHQVPKHGLCQ